MNRKHILSAACAALLLLIPLMIHLPDFSDAQAHKNAAAVPDTQKEGTHSSALFPDLDVSSISRLDITAPDRSFSFVPGGAGKVSVNGQQGDSEAFTTLVSQIAELPVSPQESFTPQDAPLLTVRISFSGSEHSVRFYRGSEDENARLIANTADNSRCGETDAWRVGTLLLACDGTRIQDERGNETPAE